MLVKSVGGGGGIPGGSDTQIQFNDAGVFGGFLDSHLIRRLMFFVVVNKDYEEVERVLGHEMLHVLGILGKDDCIKESR